MCCDSPPAPQAPNYQPIQAASDHAADMGYKAANEDLAFRKQTYADSQPRQQQLYDLASKVANQQMDIAGQNQTQANKQWQDYQQTYRPNEQNTMADAYGQQYLGDEDRTQLNQLLTGGGGTMTDAERMSKLQGMSSKAENTAGDAAAARAGGQVNASYSQMSRELGRMGGGDPSRMAAMGGLMANQQSLVSAGASNQAREGVRGQMLGLRTGAANFGRNMPNTAGQAFGLATQAGSSATANQNTGFMSGLPYAQFQSGGYGTQLGAAGMAGQQALGMGGVLNQGYGIGGNIYGQAQQANGQMLGSIVGAGLMGGGMWMGGRR